MTYGFRLLLLVAVVYLNGCSDGWRDFDKFKDMDVQGETISCEQLASTEIDRGDAGVDTLVDYLHHSKYTFKQCGPEIAERVGSYCKRYLDSVVESYTNNVFGDEPGSLYRYNCQSYIDSALAEVDSRYDLPNASSAFLVLHDAGKMIRPDHISQVSFSEVIKGRLWKIVLHTDDKSVSLYFGNEEKWEHAKVDFAKLPREEVRSPANDGSNSASERSLRGSD